MWNKFFFSCNSTRYQARNKKPNPIAAQVRRMPKVFTYIALSVDNGTRSQKFDLRQSIAVCFSFYSPFIAGMYMKLIVNYNLLVHSTSKTYFFRLKHYLEN